MATGGEIKSVLTDTYKAGAAIVAGRAVKISAKDTVIHTAALGTDPGIGIALEDQSIVGEGVKVMLFGICFGTSSAAISRGAKVSGDAAGKIIASVATYLLVGVAIREATGADEDIPILVIPSAAIF